MIKKIIALLMLSLVPLCSCASNEEIPASSQVLAEQSEVPEQEIVSEREPQNPTATLSFGGDILIHTPLFSSAKTEDGYDFVQFFPEMEGFFDSDINLVNVENPIDANGDNSGISTYPRFNNPREITDLLEYMGIDTVTFVNNHVYDKKYSGFVRTVNLLREKFDVVGAYLSEEEYNTPQIFDVNGIKIGILSYADHVNGQTNETLVDYSLRMFDIGDYSADKILDDVTNLKSAGAEYVIVTLHWGREYKDYPSDSQKEFAYTLTDGGVDMILGGHSHCVQPIERREITDENGETREAVIIYSMGNFLADQTGLQTSEGPSYIKTQQGMKVTVALEKDLKTGKITVTEGTYTPTMLFREKISSGKYNYKLLAIKQYYDLGEAIEMPEIFFSNRDWEKCREAYERVTGIVGDTFMVA